MSRSRRLVATVAALAASATWATAYVPVAACAATPGIVINEVASTGTQGDFVELSNPTSAAIDVSGWVIKDNDDTHAFKIPAGTTIAPGGYHVVQPDVTGGFGLGSADSARVFLADGTTLVDSYAWTAHGAPSWGRCPDSVGAMGKVSSLTMGAKNDCPAVPGADSVVINEIESSGGVPGDWVELYNKGTAPVDVSGWTVVDNDATHTPAALPAGSVIPAGGYLVVEESTMGFGLGAADSVTLAAPDKTMIDTYAWTAHAAQSYARCPNGLGAFKDSTSVTKGAVNNCSSPVRINEVESNGGTPGDWIELVNPTSGPVDIGGYVVKDNDDTHNYVIPAGTTIAPGGYYVVEEAQLGFGLGGADNARIFAPDGTTLVDIYEWTAHAATSYGRCPDATGPFEGTKATTKGAVNSCAGDIVTNPWPGKPDVAVADDTSLVSGDLSGLDYDATTKTMWAVVNGTGTLLKLSWDEAAQKLVPVTGWEAGSRLSYPDGTGTPDSEGVTVGPNGTILVGTERNNAAGSVSRMSVLQFTPGATAGPLKATREWNLNSQLPVMGANLGIEAIEFVPDAALTKLVDKNTGAAYNPATYGPHGGGLYFVGLEGNGMVYAFALMDDGTSTLVAELTPGLAGVMALNYDADTTTLWATCDDTCQGRSALFDLSQASYATPKLVDRPANMPNINNEGLAIAPVSACVAGYRPVWWTDDTDTDGHSIRVGWMDCPARPTLTGTPVATGSYYAGTTPKPTYTIKWTGFTNGDTETTADITGAPSCTSAGESATAAGTYAITCTQGTLASSKYYFQFAEGSLDVKSGLYPVTPSRIADTRHGTGLPATRLAAGASVTVKVAGAGGVPVGATGAYLNITAINPTDRGWVTVSPTGSTPTTSTMNYADHTIAGATLTRLGADGAVTIHNSGPGVIDLAVDTFGFVVGDSSTVAGDLKLQAPSRLADTRFGFGAPAAKIPANGSITIPVGGRAGLPATAGAAVLNIVAVEPAAAGYLTAYPAGTARPRVSTLNFVEGTSRANLAVTRLGAEGSVTIFNGSSTPLDVAVDVSGYAVAGTPTLSGHVGTVAPVRLVDTRQSLGAPAALPAGGSFTYAVAGKGGVPAVDKTSMVFTNVTSVTPSGTGFISQWPSGLARSITSVLNVVKGETAANAALGVLGTDGGLSLYNGTNGPTDLLSDVTGYVVR